MFRFIKKFFQTRKIKKDIAKTKRYYEIVRSGAIFLQYIDKDMKRQENQMNRAKKRRIRLMLQRKGKFNIDVINHYKNEIDKVLEYIKSQETALKTAK